ncbi:MAG: beta-ketoacyl-ACP synthase III [Longimicrobiales bacterium]|nr:beta-ketoacyl-ACP synthase III [Longimicrobiales bacterium]
MTSPKPLVEFAGTGRFLPDRVVTNEDMAQIVETNDEWIRTRTGIRERRIADEQTTVAAMGAEAGRRAMERAGIGPEDVGILIVSTATPDRWLPSTACDVQALLECSNALAFDVSAACSGWLYALTMAEGYLAMGRTSYALVIAAEMMTSIVDWTDRTTCVLFGDGAGAAVLRRAEGAAGIVSSFHRSDGHLAEMLYRPGGGAAIPMDADVLARGDHLVRMSGKEVFKSAVRSMAEASARALEGAGMTGADVDLLIPHQANIRIIESTARYAGIPMEKVYVNVDRYGNMSSASIPVALDEALEEGRIQPGMRVLTATFGAGLTWGAMVWQF